MAEISEISDNTIFRVINEGQNVEWNFYALKVMIMRLRLKLTMSDNLEETNQQCFTDLRNLFFNNRNIPNVKKDFQIIVEKFGLN